MKSKFRQFWLLNALLAVLMSSTAASSEINIEQFMEDAENGDHAAQLILAICFRDGKGVDRDNAEALRWGHLAADGGNAEAMDFVGYMFFAGRGVKPNHEIAAGYFKASSDSVAAGAWNLGRSYFAGLGVDQDIPKALESWKKAAEMGHGPAASTAAMVHLAGDGVPADLKLATQLAERAVAMNDPNGHVLLGEIHFQAGDDERARELWSKVAAMNPTKATSNPENPSGETASQQGADLIRLIEYRQRQMEPGKFALVEVPHLLQGWNNCGATSCSMLARANGESTESWAIKKLCPSPMGTGTDWADLVEAAGELDLKWEMLTFAESDEGFEEAIKFAREELDAGRPLVIDFKYIGDRYPG
ncbi:MAG: tetratricopeptide repeat protein, partial [Verrucomicrobiota bacterium]